MCTTMLNVKLEMFNIAISIRPFMNLLACVRKILRAIFFAVDHTLCEPHELSWNVIVPASNTYVAAGDWECRERAAYHCRGAQSTFAMTLATFFRTHPQPPPQ